MEAAEIRSLVKTQREWFRTGATLPLNARRKALSDLRTAMEEFQPQVHQALMEDLGKCEQEAFMCETGLAMSELS